MKIIILFFTLFSFTIIDSASLKLDPELQNSINNSFRSKKHVIRDKYRNPLETLTFFEIDKNKKVLEISPGSRYYSEIISHYLKSTDNYFVTEYKFPPVEAVKKGQKKI